MRAKVKGQRGLKLDVGQFRSVVRVDKQTALGPVTRFFVRMGEREYRELSPNVTPPAPGEKLRDLLRDEDLTLAQVDEALSS